MNRKNPNYPPWHCFTAMLCNKCGEMYEADREHICRKKNSYPIREPKGKSIQIPKWRYNENTCVCCGESIPEGAQICPKCNDKEGD